MQTEVGGALMSGASEMTMGVFETDHRCTHCGYNLRGLPRGGRCPECGTVARMSRSATYGHTPMVEVSKRYLHWLSVGLFMMGCTFGLPIAILLISLLFFEIQSRVLLGTVYLGCVLWPVGVLIALRPRPLKQNAGAGLFGREWLVLRGLVAVTQVGAFCLNLGFSFAAEVTGSFVLWVASGVFGVIWLLGMSALCVYLAELAWWGEDDQGQSWFHNCAWGIGIGSLGSLVCAGLYIPTESIVLLVFGTPFVLVMLLSVLGMVIKVFSLASTVRWAIRNAESAQARDARIAEKQRREEEQARRERGEAGVAATPEQERIAREVLAREEEDRQHRPPGSGAGAHPHARQGIVIDRTNDGDIYSLEDDGEEGDRKSRSK